MAIWPSPRAELSRSLSALQTECQEPAISSLLGAHAIAALFLFSGGVLRSNSGFFSKAVASLAPEGPCCRLLRGLVGAPSLSLGVVCLPGNPILLSHMGTGNDGKRNIDAKLEYLLEVLLSPLPYSLASEHSYKIMGQIKT